MKRNLVCALLAIIAAASSAIAEPEQEQHETVGEICAQAHEPLGCMESYGFRCQQDWQPEGSIDAQRLACNLDLADGRKHFVQMVSNNGEWRFELQRTYDAKPRKPRDPYQDPSAALREYIRQLTNQYRGHSKGAGSDNHGRVFRMFAGTQRVEGRIEVVAACGSTYGSEDEEQAETDLVNSCEDWLTEAVVSLGQSTADEVFQIAAMANIKWNKNKTTLVSGDSALIVEGRYRFEDAHTPCIWNSDCCPREGIYLLNSCRNLDDKERHVIEACLPTVDSTHTDEYNSCLRSGGVKVGCEEQPDGSKICY